MIDSLDSRCTIRGVACDCVSKKDKKEIIKIT